MATDDARTDRMERRRMVLSAVDLCVDDALQLGAGAHDCRAGGQQCGRSTGSTVDCGLDQLGGHRIRVGGVKKSDRQ